MTTKKPSPAKKPASKPKPAAARSGKAKASSPGRSHSSSHDAYAVLRKAFLIGLGATAMTGDRLRASMKELADDMVARGDIKSADVKNVVEDIKRRFADAKAEVEKLTRRVGSAAKP